MNKRIEEEKAVVGLMIRLYCRKHEGNKTLCPKCKELLTYANGRLDHCRYGSGKPTCKKCAIHCYRTEMKERIRIVMRWAGPRMILYMPFGAMWNFFRELFLKRLQYKARYP